MNPFLAFADTSPARGSLRLKAIPALLLTCFVTQPLFAQTASPDATKAAQAAAAKKTTGAAQASKDTTTGQAADETATVEVVASRPTNKVDRDVYSLKNDISVSNASAADVLNNVPSVAVDPDGNVTLRGNSNVQIMVNGKRDAQFQGQNRGDVLNSFAAENIDSIEVINVPGAEFGNEGGSGPIINLVLKRNRKPGSRANLSVNKGTEGRTRAFLNGEHAAGPYSISGNLGVFKDERANHNETQRKDLDPATGNTIGGSNAASDRAFQSQAVMLGTTFTYNVGERDQAGATASYSKRKVNSDNDSSTMRFGSNTLPIADFSSVSRTQSPSENFGFGASYDHRSGKPGEDLKFDLRYTGQNNNRDMDVWYDYRLRPDRYATNSHRETDSRNRILDISADYERLLWETWQLKAGVKYADSKNSNPTNYLAVDPVTGDYVPVPSRISDFESDDRNAALYGILSTKLLDALSVQGGVRGEYTRLDVHQPLLDQENQYTYMNWLPSFYATYDLSNTSQLQLRASRRIARPNERDLNPNLVYLSDFGARQGNPHLEPVNNDLFEVAYRARLFDIDSSFVLFKRRESPVISNRSYPLTSDPNVLVSSPLNFGANDATGVDLNFNMRKLFIEGLSANLGATLGNEKRQRVFNFSSSQAVEQTNHRQNIKLRLAYQFDAESLQLNVNRNGSSLNGQGTNSAMTMTSFSWQHRLSPRLTLNLNVRNVFHSGSMESITENEELWMHSVSSAQPRVVMLGLRYQWGGVTGDERIRNGGMHKGMFHGPRGEGGGYGHGGEGGGYGGGGFGGGGGGYGGDS
jgi:outer membrane receptor protein involved in Fe transport